ncbi:MAG: 6-bladed beta-propeller [Clostridium sp.]|nr:6-bladed beta-propeller [Clostridium sp.]
MKKIVFLSLTTCLLTYSCRQASVTEIRPLNETTADTTRTILVEEKLPCIELETDNAIHLQVSDEKNVNSEKEQIKAATHYLALETKEECLVGHIDKMESDGQDLFLFDKSNNQVLRFSGSDGSFQNKFGNTGRGPGEFIRITDMSLNKKAKEVCLLDAFGYKLLHFNYDGALVREEPMFYYYNSLEFAGDGMVICTDMNDNEDVPPLYRNRLVLADANQTPRHIGFAFTETLSANLHQGLKHGLMTCGEEVYYNHVLSDTIWRVKEEGVCEAAFIFKFPGRDNLFDDKDFQGITDEQYEEKTAGVPHYRDEIIITKDFVKAIINGADNILYYIPTGHYIYGKPQHQSFAMKSAWKADFAINGTSFVKVLQPFDIIRANQRSKQELDEEMYEFFINSQLTEKERQLLSTMTEEDNPILMIMDIEPF